MSSIELYFEDEDDLEIVERARKRKRIRDASNPLELDEALFISNFRLSKVAFVALLNEIQPKFKAAVRLSSIPNVIKLCTALRFFAQGSYQSSVGNDCSIALAQPTVSLVLKEVTDALESVICPKWIKFEYTDEEKFQAKYFFHQKSGIPGIIGCVDGSHISIIAPGIDIQHVYYNRKGFYSLNAMIVCDHKMAIKYINARFPGSSHDSAIWEMSRLKSKLQTDYENGDRNTWLLGDAGYPLSPYLLTPYRNVQEGSAEARFNTNHSKARILIERTIGMLKTRFRCLLGARQLNYSPERTTKIINVCSALHNICIFYNVQFSDEVIYDEIDDVLVNSVDEEAVVDSEGGNIRNRILRSMQL